ncbi:MAG: RNA polymerase sigma factor [Polyangiaceae bacterium]
MTALSNFPNHEVTNVTIDRTATDDALLAAIAAGNRAAVGILYARHADSLRTAAVAALPKHDEPSADDIVQEVFLALLEGRAGAFQPARGKVLAWLKGIARREALALHAPPPTEKPVKTLKKGRAS